MRHAICVADRASCLCLRTDGSARPPQGCGRAPTCAALLTMTCTRGFCDHYSCRACLSVQCAQSRSSGDGPTAHGLFGAQMMTGRPLAVRNSGSWFQTNMPTRCTVQCTVYLKQSTGARVVACKRLMRGGSTHREEESDVQKFSIRLIRSVQ